MGETEMPIHIRPAEILQHKKRDVDNLSILNPTIVLEPKDPVQEVEDLVAIGGRRIEWAEDQMTEKLELAKKQQYMIVKSVNFRPEKEINLVFWSNSTQVDKDVSGSDKEQAYTCGGCHLGFDKDKKDTSDAIIVSYEYFEHYQRAEGVNKQQMLPNTYVMERLIRPLTQMDLLARYVSGSERPW